MNKKGDRWHIAFCVDDKYSDYIRPAILSIAYNNRDHDICIHILSDNISEKNSGKISDVVSDLKNIFVEFHKIDDTRLQKLKVERWSIHTWYRILLPDILDNNIDRVLYLDADTLVTGDLHDLFSIDMSNAAIAGAIDFQSVVKWEDNAPSVFERLGYDPEKGYICAGVLMMNLNFWRENNLGENMVRWGLKNHSIISCPDQDTINYLCRDNKIILPMKYGFMNCFYTRKEFQKPPFEEEFRECMDNPVIIHYNGTAPWFKEYKRHIRHYEWEKYNSMLKHPVKKTYKIKGILLLKHLVYKHLIAKNKG